MVLYGDSGIMNSEDELKRIADKIDNLVVFVAKSQESLKNLHDEQASEKVIRRSNEKYFRDYEREINTRFANQTKEQYENIKQLKMDIDAMHDKLSHKIDNVDRKSNINLKLGSGFATIVMSILAYLGVVK